MTLEVTAFGSALTSPEQAAAALRARAAAAGAELRPVPVADLVTAVVAATAWLAGTCADSFDEAHRSPAALAGVFCRAAGWALMPAVASEVNLALRLETLMDELALRGCAPVPDGGLVELTRVCAWAEQWTDPVGALVAAAEDLSSDLNHSGVAGACDALTRLAADRM